MRIKKKHFNVQYIAMRLKEMGNREEFFRSNRPSLQRMRDIEIGLPSIERQQEFELMA